VLPSVKVALGRKAGFRGALLLNVEGQKIGVEREVAAKILVEASK
jgi:Fe2+ transport system protein FeoA